MQITKPSLLFTALFVLTFFSVRSQGFITEIETEDISVILNSPTFVTLANGDTLSGKMTSCSLGNGYVKDITLKLGDGTKRKLKPEDMLSLKVKASRLAKLSMINESGSSIKELSETDFNQIINREYIIFERALRGTKKDKPAMMQLLNPGFDHAIKVYADPDAQETGGFEMNGVALTGGKERSYLFVKGNEKAVIVRRRSYRKNFEELYSDCPEMVEAFVGEKVKFEDVAGHVFLYDQRCGG